MVSWPTFLLTSAHHFSRVDKDGTEILHSGSGLYYGLTWSKDRFYLGCRNNFNGVLEHKVLELDSSYRVLGALEGEYRQLHQMLFVEGGLYVTATEDNAVDVVVDQKRRRLNWTGEETDTNHINSIWFDGAYFWVCYHNNCTVGSGKSSQVVRLSGELDSVEEVFTLGKSIHNVFATKEFVYVCNSREGVFARLSRDTGQVDGVALGPWVRGLAATDDYFLVGTSRKGSRDTRMEGDLSVHLLDRKTLNVLDTRCFEEFGAVFEIRVIGQRDYAHNGITFPGGP